MIYGTRKQKNMPSTEIFSNRGKGSPHLPDGSLLSRAEDAGGRVIIQHLEDLGGDHGRRVPHEIEVENRESQTQHDETPRDGEVSGGGGAHACYSLEDTLLVRGGVNDREGRRSAE